MKRALITGLTGQDGSYLAALLLSKGYEVVGLVRRTSNDPFARFPEDVRANIRIIYGNLRDKKSIERALKDCEPDEIYNLAAMSDVKISFAVPEETFAINYGGVKNLMDSVRKIVPKAKIYQASTSEMFGSTKPPQSERSAFRPVSPYGKAKFMAHRDYIKGYRDKYKLFAVSGILFNHESPRRGEHFVTRKITICLSKIKLGLLESFELGNLDARRDWGYAGDYVEAMWLMLQQKTPKDFVIATGESHTVREFLQTAADALGMKLRFEGAGLDEVVKDEHDRVIVRVNPKFYRPNEVDALRGDASKAKKVLHWKPRHSFRQLVAMMVKSDMDSLSRKV